MLIKSIKKTQKKRQEGRIGYVGMFVRIMFATLRSFVTLFLLFSAITSCYFCYKKYPEVKQMEKDAYEMVNKSDKNTFLPEVGSEIYDRNGNKIIKVTSETKRYKYIPYDEISDNVKNSFIAIEDNSFWKNPGYDLKGMVRVVGRYIVTKGKEAHGASTITQQLSRGVFLNNNKTVDRKIKEFFVAKYLTKKYSKQEILEYYCNTVCFGNNIYGIEEASEEYFGKSAKDLTLAEASFLCSIPNRPSWYNPWVDINRIIPRQTKILRDMVKLNMITEQDKIDALSTVINVKPRTQDSGIQKEKDTYLSTYAIYCTTRELMKNKGFEFKYKFKTMDEYNKYEEKYSKLYKECKNDIYSGRYKIYTSLDINVQNNLQNIVTNKVNSYGISDLECSETVIDNKNGKVIAMVGGKNPNEQYVLNRGYTGYRQPGSTIKPLVVYGVELEKNVSPDETIKKIDIHSANKGKEVVTGSMTLRHALEVSNNECAYYLYRLNGPAKGMDKLTLMEYQKITPNDYNLASGLGGFTYGTTTLEQAGGYSTINNGGVFRNPTCITSIKDVLNREVYKSSPNKVVYTKESTDKLKDVMQGVLTRGTARRIHFDQNKCLSYGKTGTTNDNKDGWFCGFNDRYTISVWLGCDKPKTIKQLQGGTYPAEVWRDSMYYILDNT